MPDTTYQALLAPPLPLAAETRDRYELLELIGRGGMGDVFRAWDNELELEVALKSIRPHVASDPRVLARFRREAKLARRIKHVNVAQMYDIVEQNGQRYLAMEYIAGKSLKEIVSSKRSLPLHVVLGLMRQICSGTDAAHRAGVIHRDLKPHNIMITRKHGRVSILDFGIARDLGEDDLTEVGVILGSPQYLSPEQLAGQPLTSRSDIYQLGIVFYEMVTGVSPFRAPGAGNAALRALREVPPDPRQIEPALPHFVASAIMACLARYPEDRPASGQAISALLEESREVFAHGATASTSESHVVPLDSGEVTFGGAPTALVATSRDADGAAIEDRLERLGCTVTRARDGVAALGLAHSRAFSLIVLDDSMAGMDGLTACQIFKRTPLGARTPVVLLVSGSDPGRSAFAREAGAAAVVNAPLNVHAFSRSIREILAA